jgi:hypothetical protein
MWKRSWRVGVAAFVAGALGWVGTAGAAVPVTQIFSDPFTNATSQHRTAVEPDTFAFGNSIVAATQSGRFFDGGSSGIGYATSTDAGSTWSSGVLPGITTHDGGGGPYDRASDPSVAFDAKHGVWLIASLPLNADTSVPGILVSRSTDGGLTFGNPVTVASAGPGEDFDKTWIACDSHSASPFYGNCYVTFDDFGDGDRLKTSTSTDGGLTWGPAKNTGDNATGLGGQPVVQPTGTVIVPAANAFETAIIAYRSTDGGATWGNSVLVSPSPDHQQAGNLRSGPLPSAEISGDGTVYVAWEDCRFRRGCKSDDIVFTSSADGLTWAPVTRVPIDDTRSGVDHFLPGLGVTGSGASAKLGLTYYFYRQPKCKKNNCQLEVGFIESPDAGATWGSHVDVAGPFPVSRIADTSQGRMVGDYISTSWVGGQAFGAFTQGNAPPPGFAFDQPLYVPTGGLAAAGAAFVHTQAGSAEQPVPDAASDHASPRSAIRVR